MSGKLTIERYRWFERQVRQQRYPNASSVAQEFVVDRKTAQRDIEFLRDRLECPLRYDTTRKGYFLPPGTAWTLEPLYLSTEELTAILLAQKVLSGVSGLRKSLPAGAGPIETELASIVKKLSGVIKESAVSPEIAEAISVQVIESSLTSDLTFRGVLKGLMDKKCISFRYYAPSTDQHTQRTVEPYHLLNYMGTWHLFAYCLHRESIRDFVISRMQDVQCIEKGFHRQKGLNNFKSVKEYVEATFGIFKGEEIEQVTLKFSPARALWVKQQMWHKDQALRELEDGSITLSLPVANFYEVKMEILKHGAHVEVLEPPELRSIIKDEIMKMTRIY
jgi:predicted DNA-binding transcriptional regulator YafY